MQVGTQVCSHDPSPVLSDIYLLFMSPSCLILLLNRHKFTDYHFNINCFTLSLLSQRFLASTSPSCSFPMLVKVVGFVTYSRDIHLYLCGLPKSLTVTREAELLPAGPVLLLHPFSIHSVLHFHPCSFLIFWEC